MTRLARAHRDTETIQALDPKFWKMVESSPPAEVVDMHKKMKLQITADKLMQQMKDRLQILTAQLDETAAQVVQDVKEEWANPIPTGRKQREKQRIRLAMKRLLGITKIDLDKGFWQQFHLDLVSPARGLYKQDKLRVAHERFTRKCQSKWDKVTQALQHRLGRLRKDNEIFR